MTMPRASLSLPLHVLDLFSGAAGGWSLGLHRAGFMTIAACEIVEWRRILYSENFPHVRLYADIRDLTATRLVSDLGCLPDIVVGSPPCQDISSANTRGKGIEGERSGLYLEAVRLVGECRPRWFAFENRSYGCLPEAAVVRLWARQMVKEAAMNTQVHQHKSHVIAHDEVSAIFISLELSKSTWLVTSISPGAGEKMSRHTVKGGDVAALMDRFDALRHKALQRTGRDFPIVTIHEAGLDGFWIHRILEREGVESHIVDAASIAVPRRHRRVKTDKVDGETLVRTLLAWKRGEPRVCSMVRVPSPEDEDRRRPSRERKVLIAERVSHVNRIKGLLYSQGVAYEPLHRNRRQNLEELRTGDGRPLSPCLKRQILRELDRLELLLEQIRNVEAERDADLKEERKTDTPPVGVLAALKGIGPEFAAVIWAEGLSRPFENRRQVAAYAGLAPTPWQSGSVNREQGVSKSGNPRLRTTMIQLAWLWLRHQPRSELSCWFQQRVAGHGGRVRKTMIAAMARKLLVALWKYLTAGVVIEGAAMKTV